MSRGPQGGIAHASQRRSTRLLRTPGLATALVFGFVLAFAAALRFYHLTRTPSNLTADETDFFRDAYFVLEGRGPGIWSQGQSSTVGPFGTYAYAWCLRIFGDSIFGLRMYTVLGSLAVISLFFLLVRFRYSLFTAFASTTLFATCVPMLHFSRSAWTNMNAAFIVMAICCSLLIAIESRHFWLFVVAGLATGLTVWAYISARLLPVAVLVFAPLALVAYAGQRKRVIAGLIVAGIISLIVALPVLWELRTNSRFETAYTERTRRVSIFDGKSVSEGLKVVPRNVERTLLGYILLSNADNNFRRSQEAVRYAPRDQELFDPLTRVLFWTGLVASIIFWRKTLLWWLIYLISLVSQVFSMGTPSMARGVVILPILFLFVALGIEQVVRSVERGVPQRNVKFGLAGVGAICIIGVALFNTHQYFDWMGSSYALQERGPYVTRQEFDVWSKLQHTAIAAGHGSFNTGTWRAVHDLGDCLTGLARGDVCASRSIETNPSDLGAALRVTDAPKGFELVDLTMIDGDTYRKAQGGRSEPLARALADKRIEEAWVSVYEAPTAVVSTNVAQFGSTDDAIMFFYVRANTHGDHFIGGPHSEILAQEPIGDQSIAERFVVSDLVWWEYYWRVGTYVGQTRWAVQTSNSAVPSDGATSLATLDRITREIAGRVQDLNQRATLDGSGTDVSR